MTASAQLGQLAENLVADWLQQQNWQILARRWRLRRGELDIVALHAEQGIAFVEVKARSRGSWDAEGLLAITPAKQVKLLFTAQMFLVAHPHLADLPCRFDVALVQNQLINAEPHLRLQQYLVGAFE